MKSKVRFLTISALILAVVIVTACVYLAVTAQKASMRQALVEGINANDGPKVDKLLKQGANPNQRGPIIYGPKKLLSLGMFEDGSTKPTPLLMALTTYRLTQFAPRQFYFATSANTHANSHIVRSLLNAGANPNVTDYYDKLPVVLAIEADNFELVDMLVHHGAKLTGNTRGLMYVNLSFDNASVPMAKHLIDLGVRFQDPIFPKNQTALHQLAMNPRSRPDAAQMGTMLIKNQCPLNSRDAAGFTALDLANSQMAIIKPTYRASQQKFIDMLVAAGAN